MSAQVWPPISHDQLKKEIDESLKAELEWLLNLLQENLASLKSGLQECVALLAPEEPGSTLALSSLRSESVKGFVTRVGTRIVKGSLQIRLPTLPPPRSHPHPSYPITLSAPLPLPQLSHLHTLLNNALDIIDISRWTGDPQNPSFISGQLRLLADTLDEARQTLKGGAGVVGGNWLDDGDGDSQGEGKEQGVFEPPLPPNLSIHLSIADAALILHIRTLAPSPSSTDLPSLSGLSLRSRLGLGPKLPTHDEVEQVLRWRGEDVCVREKVRVESADPSLMAVMAKLSALGHAVGGWRLKVAVVVGEEVEG